MRKFLASMSIVLGACQYPPSGDDEIGSGGTDTGTGTGTTGAPECTIDADCPNPAAPICDDGVCVACVSDLECDEPYPDCIEGWCAKPCENEQSDPLEPNDDPSNATVLSGDDDWPDLWLCPGDEDWFEITFSSPHFVSIVTNNDSLDGNLDMFLLDANSNEVDSSTSGFYGSSVPRAVEAIHMKTAMPVTGNAVYRVRLTMPDGVGGLPYRLQFQAFPEG